MLIKTTKGRASLEELWADRCPLHPRNLIKSPKLKALRRRHPGAHPPSPASRASTAYQEVIEAAVARGLTAQRIWQDLREEFGYGHGYASVRRFVRRLK